MDRTDRKAPKHLSTTEARWIRRGVLGLALLAPVSASAAPADDASPEARVEAVKKSGDPIALAEVLQEFGGRGEAAAKKGDQDLAARYWRALTDLVPDRAFAFGRLCDALDAGGRLDEALVACRTALTRQGTTAGDYTHFVKLLLAQEGALTAADRRQIDVAIVALAKEPAAAQIVERVRCNVAAHDHDLAGLEACTRKLVAVAPANASTIAFEWTLALEKNDLGAARQHLQRAKDAGLDRASFAPLARRTEGPGLTRAQRFVRWALLGLLAPLFVFAAYTIVARATAARRRRFAAGT